MILERVIESIAFEAAGYVKYLCSVKPKNRETVLV